LKKFAHKDKNKKFCSQKCVKEHSKKGINLICFNCEQIVYVSEYRAKKYKKVFCSLDCSRSWQVKRRPTRICENCKIFFKKKSRSNAMFCSLACRLNSDYNINQLANMRKKQSHHKINNLEKKGYKLLSDMKFEFEIQWIFGKRFVADAYLKDYNAIVQFDGDYWHGNPKIFKNLSEMQQKNKRTDERANAVAKKEGLKILRFWEHDIKNNENCVKNKIFKFLKENKSCHAV
jgi:very-short-patch-repair endonuclease